MAVPLKVFITGASSGLGVALARHYAGSGATLGLVARRRDKLEQLAQAIAVQSPSTAIYALDVADHAAMGSAAADFCNRYGVPDIVIANAGISAGTRCDNIEDIAVTERVLRTNVIGLAATLTPFVAPMRARGSGSLVAIASVAGFRGLPGNGAYSTSKAAAINWMEALRVELHGSGVHAITICPGYIETPMTAVNRFPMPFLLSAAEAARRIARAIATGRSLVIVPWQMRLVFAMLKHTPNWLFDRLFARAPRKSRYTPE